MQTRRDQVQAYRFVTRRIGSALLSGEPETNELPMRRLGLSMFGSAMVAVIVFAGAGVFGLLTNRSDPLEQNTLVIEEETRARYVYVDGRLHPVENYASARLILEAADPTVREVGRDALQEIPRGHKVGIAGAPDAVPDPDDLLSLPWRVCSVPGEGDSPRPRTVVVIGRELTGGRSALGAQGLYVTDGQDPYLLWNDTLLRITHPVPLVALGLSATEPVEVGEQLLNSVAAGPDLEVVTPDGFGELSEVEVLGDVRELVGFIYRAADQHYVLTRRGLVPVSELTVALRQTAADVRIREITGGLAASLQLTTQPLEPEGFPQTAPQMHPATGGAPTVCAGYRGPGGSALSTTIEVFDATPPELEQSAPGLVPATQTDRDEVATVDQVLVSGGQGALVESVPVAGATAAELTTYLLTDEGERYPLGDQTGDARAALGYGEVSPIAVPAALLALVPRGPTLEVADARQPVDVSAGRDGTAADAGG